mgnify:CR=1 FL=1
MPIDEVQVVRRALDVQARLLDELGEHEEAARVRARQPIERPEGILDDHDNDELPQGAESNEAQPIASGADDLDKQLIAQLKSGGITFGEVGWIRRVPKEQPRSSRFWRAVRGSDKDREIIVFITDDRLSRKYGDTDDFTTEGLSLDLTKRLQILGAYRSVGRSRTPRGER